MSAIEVEVLFACRLFGYGTLPSNDEKKFIESQNLVFRVRKLSSSELKMTRWENSEGRQSSKL